MAASIQLAEIRVEPGASSGIAWRMLERWHLLSLDAPAVAAVWAWAIARAAHVVLPGTAVSAMFLAVWVLYASDRLLDARWMSQGAADGLEARHFFHHRHRAAFCGGIAAGCAVLACLLPEMGVAELKLYLILGALLAGWFVAIHFGKRPLPKEFVVGIFFAAAVFIPTVARGPQLRAELLLPAVLFGAVCSLNCLFIFAWEHDVSEPAEGLAWTRFASRHVIPCGGTLLLACLAILPFRERTEAILIGEVAVSAGLSLALHAIRHRFARTTLRAAADLVLLSPVLTAWWLR